MSNEILDAAIIGAGLAGLRCAQVLQEAGRRVRVVDKGRGPGGRMAARRIERDGVTALFDHGAQFFTARSPEFRAQVESWQSAGLARPWFHGQATLLADGTIDEKPDGHPRFCCSRGMTALAKEMAQDVDVETKFRVARLEHEADAWTLHGEGGEHLKARALVMTPPVPQSLDLLDASAIALPKELREVLGAMLYERCIAVMAWVSEPPRLPSQGALYAKTDKLVWLSDNATKGISDVPALTLHGAPDWSLKNWTSPDDGVVSELCEAARAFWSGEVVASSVARWKFSKPIEPRNDGCQTWRDKQLIFAGDAFGGAKVEGAWTSGGAAAREVLAA